MNHEQHLTKEEQQFLDDIVDAYTKDNLIPVIGSGLSVPFQFPNWAKLVKIIADAHDLSGEDRVKIDELLQKADYLGAIDELMEKAGLSEEQLQAEVAGVFSEAKENVDLTQDSNYKDLEKMQAARFLTTNYDELLYDIAGGHFVELKDIGEGKIESNTLCRDRYRKAVFPIHGEISHPERIVFSRSSYEALYETDAFEASFLFLRASYTFLFIGFSFDDYYIQSLFDKVIGKGHLRQSHYILFANSKKGSPEVERLRREYGIKPIFYDTKNGRIEAIRQILTGIIRFVDDSIDISSMEFLSSAKKEENPKEVEEILLDIQDAIEREEVSEVKKLCDRLLMREDYGQFPVLTRQKIGCYLIWYYSYLQQYEESEIVMNQMDQDSELYACREKCAVMYLQLLWNARNWEKAEDYLKTLTKKEKLILLFEDIIKISKEILPSSKERVGEIKVYGEEEWSEELKQKRHSQYLAWKGKYVNPKTYNLLELKEYKDLENQEIAYYWLGIMAGQLFHEYREAVEYLYRANEITQARRYYEALAENYLSIGEEKVKYQKESKYYDLDMEALLNARRCFQYAMQTQDEEFKKSLYRKSGAMYLQVLAYLKKYHEYEEFYKEAERELPDEYGLKLQKAQVDAEYFGEVSKEELAKLNEDDQFYIELVAEFSKIQFYQGSENADKAQKIYRDIISKIWKRDSWSADERIFPILHDCLFFTGQLSEQSGKVPVAFNTRIKANPELAGFYKEATGDLMEAEKAFREKFDLHKDISTFTVLNSFYVRTRQKEKSDRLYQEVLAGTEIVGDRTDIIQGYILNYINVWREPLKAVELYLNYYDAFEDTDLRTELEEMLKPFLGDYSDCDNRIKWNREMLRISPKEVKEQFYGAMFYLYISNLRFQEAGALLDEMKKCHCRGIDEMEKLQAVMSRPQRGSFYSREPQCFSPRRLPAMKENMKQDGIFCRYCFGRRGQKVFLPISWIILLYSFNRQAELKEFDTVKVTFAGIIKLEKCLFSSENPLFRMVLQGLSKMKNLEIEAADMRTYMEVLSENKKKADPEMIQSRAYLRENKENWSPV